MDDNINSNDDIPSLTDRELSADTPDESPTPSCSTNQNETNRPKQYLTKHRKLTQKSKDKQEKKVRYEKAVRDMHRGKFKSLRKCASHYKVPISTLHRIITSGDDYVGSGRALQCLSMEASEVQGHNWLWSYPSSAAVIDTGNSPSCSDVRV